MKLNMTLFASTIYANIRHKPVINAASLLVLAASLCASISAFAQSFTVDGVDSSTTNPCDIVCVGSTVNITVTPSCTDESVPSASVGGASGISSDVTLTNDGNGNWNGSFTASTAGTFSVSASDDCPDSFDDITLTVVQLNSVTISGAADVDGVPTPSILDVNYATLKTNSTNDFVTLTADLIPNNTNAATLLTWSAGQVVPGNLVTKIPKNVANKTEVMASCCSAFFTKDIWVISAIIKSLQFTSDHGVMTTNNSDWTDCSTTFQKPEWVADASHPSYPVSQTKNTDVNVDVTVNIQPAGVPFNLLGSGGGLSSTSFGASSDTSSGSDQTKSVTIGTLPNQVAIVNNFNISWSISAFDGVFDCGASVSSGPHKIYVTYDTPAGTAGASHNSITEQRMSQACTWASGNSAANDIVSTLGPIIMGSGFFDKDRSIRPHVDEGLPADYDTAWELFGYIGISKGDCISEATLMTYALDMLGVTGSTAVTVYPCHNNWDALIGGPSETDSSLGILVYYQSGSANEFEGCCVYGGQYWPGLYGGFSSAPWASAHDVLEFVSGPNTSGTGWHQGYVLAPTVRVKWPDQP